MNTRLLAKFVATSKRWRLSLFLTLTFVPLGCVTVRPEQRAVLADPTMQYEASPLEEEARQHVYDNREGTYGGGSVEGGGCGCN